MKLSFGITATLLSASILSISGLAISSAADIVRSPIAQVDGLGDCTCVTAPYAIQNNVMGNLSLINGDVLYSGPDGFQMATHGAHLVPGSQVNVGANSSVFITVGLSCNLTVPANVKATITQPAGPGGQVCVKLSDPPEPVVAAKPNILLPLLIGGGVALAVGLGNEGASSASD